MTSVLIVEDNARMATTIERFLRERGQLVVAAIAPSAEIALAKLEQVRVDLVLVDVALPGISGIDFVARVCQRYPELPCLMLSGHNEATTVQRALNAGAKGYVIKSNPLAILVAIQEVLAGKIYLGEGLRKPP